MIRSADPLSTFIPVGVTFDGRAIDPNVASELTQGRFTLDITTGGATTAPEPTSLALLGAGLLGAGVLAPIRRRRKAT